MLKLAQITFQLLFWQVSDETILLLINYNYCEL